MGLTVQNATITDLWGLYIYFLGQILAWDVSGQLVGYICLVLPLNWRMLSLQRHTFSFVPHSSDHTWCISVCTQNPKISKSKQIIHQHHRSKVKASSQCTP